MSILITPDTGPSYILHEPTPGRGPAVCGKCVHVRKGDLAADEFAQAWRCGAVPEKVLRPAGVDPITGEHVPAQTERTRCTERNKTGECKDFDTAPPDGPRAVREGASTVDERDSDGTPSVGMVAFVLGLAIGAGLMAMFG